MKLYVNDKWMSIPIKFFVKDENNNDVYEIFYSFGRNITIKDLNYNRNIYIGREFLNWSPVYTVNINNQYLFKMEKERGLFNSKYFTSNGYKVNGDIRMLTFDILDDKNNIIGIIKRVVKFIRIGKDCAEKYEVTILDANQKELILSIVGVIVEEVKRTHQPSD